MYYGNKRWELYQSRKKDVVLNPGIINKLWMFSCFPGWIRYKLSRNRIKRIQEKILHKIIKKNQDCDFGLKHSFCSISNVNDYKKKVPLSTYDDYEESIQSICNGENRILTVEDVKLLEPTSGSTSASKLIPYTRSLKKDFQKGISPWIFDLFLHNPKLMDGSAYWSVSPALQTEEMINSKISIGFESDTSYLTDYAQRFLKIVMAVPNEVKMIKDIQSFQYVTLLFLLAREDLRLISIWNPTFLMILFDLLIKWWDSLLSDLSNRKIRPPSEIDDKLKSYLEKKLNVGTKRLQVLRQCSPNQIKNIWPSLDLVSCWSNASSEVFCKKMKEEYLPDISIQGKGLIATESFVSFPLYEKEGSVLSINSHFFEFKPINDRDNTLLAHELELNKKYEVIITTNGGLYRYQLHDQIEIIDFDLQVPIIRFIGRGNNISDLFGEKLNEIFVEKTVKNLMRANKLKPNFVMVAPEKSNNSYRYILFLDISFPNKDTITSLELEFDRNLRKNFHYNYCRKLKQLKKANIKTVDRNATKKILELDIKNGIKLGDIKPKILRSTTGWKNILLR